MNVTALVLALTAIAVALCLVVLLPTVGNALLATARFLLHPWQRSGRPRPHRRPGRADAAEASAAINANPDLTDPYDAALTAWHTHATGAPTADLASHPNTGKVHNRRGRRAIDVAAKLAPHRRQHTPTPGLAATAAGGDATAGITGRLNTDNLRTRATADAFTDAFTHAHLTWFVRLAESTDDPAVAATAWAAATSLAWRSNDPDLPDLACRAASMADLVDYDGLAGDISNHLRITITLPGGQQLTIADRRSWLPAAAAATADNTDDTYMWLRHAPVDDPAVEVLRIVEQARNGRPTPLPSTHLTAATNRIAAGAVSHLP